MRKILFTLSCIISCLMTSHCLACIRVDVEDRPPEEVKAKSIALASSEPFTNITGSIWVDFRRLSSGIALDPYTILTAAHCHSNEDEEIKFSLNSNAISALHTLDYKLYTVTRKPIIHPSFQKFNRCIESTWRDNQRYVGDIPLATASKFTFDEYNNSSLADFFEFTGSDLAILKLDEPLEGGHIYPDVLSLDEPVVDRYGTILGYGAMKFNYQEPGPLPVTDTQDDMYVRHLLSCKLYSYSRPDTKLFFGNYRGLVKNGKESFIPSQNMLKTEGLMVAGDSGGPLFLKTGNSVQLAGINSRVQYLFPFFINDDQEHRDVLGDLTQPLFPIWTDIRYYKEWIQENMGPTHLE